MTVKKREKEKSHLRTSNQDSLNTTYIIIVVQPPSRAAWRRPLLSVRPVSDVVPPTTHQTYVRFPRFYQERTEDSERKESNKIQRYCHSQVVLLLLVPWWCRRAAHCRRLAAHQTNVRFPRFYQERTERKESNKIQRYRRGQVVLLLTLRLGSATLARRLDFRLE